MSIQNKNRIPSLDGLRAISIFLVVFSHAFKPRLIDLGNLGVKVFFIISSYLIVGILLKDVKMKRFSLKTFYFKRIIRTFPAFYVYLFSVYIVLFILKIFDWEQFWRAPIYLTNYQPRSDWQYQQWFVGHSWSLAVEEQFYILVALLFLLLNKQILNQKKLLIILFSIICIVPIIRVCYLYFTSIPEFLTGSIHRSFETVADSLAVGGILAIYGDVILEKKWFLFLKNKTFLLILIILGIMMLNSPLVSNDFGLKPRYLYNLFGLTVVNAFLGIIMMVFINFPKSSFFVRALNYKWIINIGLWSYSIYLWQQIWLYNWNFSLYYKFAGILVCSLLSYYLIELPFLKIRNNYLSKKINDF